MSDRDTLERNAALAQVDRLRKQIRRLNVGLNWIAQEQHCHHTKDGGVCLSCYARTLLRNPNV